MSPYHYLASLAVMAKKGFMLVGLLTDMLVKGLLTDWNHV